MKKEKLILTDFFYSKPISFIIMLMICLSCCSLNTLPFINKLIGNICLIICIIIFFIYILNKKYSLFCIFLMIFWGTIFLSSYLGQYSTIKLAFYTYYKFIALVFYMDYGLRFYYKNITFSLYKVLCILTIINFYTIIKYPNGWFKSSNYENNWFFGYDNTHIFMYLPTLMIMFINRELNKKKLKIFDIIIFLIITYCVYYCMSANTVVAYTIFIIYLIFRKIFDNSHIFNAKNYFIVFIAIFFGIVIFRIQNVFSWLIVDILNKDLTFTHRTTIWDTTIELIKKHWILGYGKEPVEIVAYKLGKSTFTHAHNTLLDITYKYGLIGLSSFITQGTILCLFVFMNNIMTKYGVSSKYGADIPLSVYGVISKLNGLYVSSILGISIGAQPIIGFNYGAEKYDRVKETLKKVIKINLIIGIVFNLMFLVFPKQIVGIFISTSDANYDLFIEFAVLTCRTFLLVCALNFLEMTTSIVVQSLGNVVKSTFVSFCRQIILFIPITLIMCLVLKKGVFGALYAGPIADSICFIICIFLFMSEIKKINKQKRINLDCKK